MTARKKEKKKKERGVLDGVELPDDRKVKRGWTEPPAKAKKDAKDKKSKDKAEKKPKEKAKKTEKKEEVRLIVMTCTCDDTDMCS